MEETNLEVQSTNNKKIYKIIGLIVLLILAGCAFYFFYWVKTPQYSLKLIQESVQNHDVVSFEKHVDTEALCTQAVDGFLAQEMSTNDMNNPLIQGIIQTVKPAIVKSLKDGFINYIRDGNFNMTNPFETNKTNNKIANSEKQNENKIKGYTRLEFKDIANTETNGNRATVDIILYDNKTDKNFTLKIGMAKLEDGTWRIDTFVNLDEFIKEYTQATKEKLDEINKQISDEISQNISINMDNVKANLQTQNIFGLIDGKVAVYIPLKNLTNQNITINNIQIQFIDNNNNIVYEKTITDNIVMQPNQENTITSNFELNPFIDKDKNLIKVFSNTTTNIIITNIQTPDKNIKYQTEL